MSRNEIYAEGLSKIIQVETISTFNQTDRTKFYRFHDLLREMFPHLFAVCTFEDFNGSFLLRWQGRGKGEPIMLMNHHDVVEATGEWKYPPFSGAIAEGKVWGRGTLDTKGGLWAMLQAADELAAEGFTPERDVYFESACTEECDGSGADMISNELLRRGIRFYMILDEGGMILEEPVGGAKGRFAMVGVGEKGCVDLKFIARSSGGHASIPDKNTPLVRLGQFMAEVEKGKLFRAEISPTVAKTFSTVSETMDGPLKVVLANSKLFAPLLKRVMPSVSAAGNAMLRTTVAFTMAAGSEGTNVLPHEAWIVGNMRTSPHQGSESSIAEIAELAKKFDIETVVLDPGVDSTVTDYNSGQFRLIEKAVEKHFDGVRTTPWIITGATDCRFLCRVSDHCLRFAPFFMTDEQVASIHAIDENIEVEQLSTAVDFYKYIITEA
ncbi:MAG: M20/M25/M40 family metallo-hydrolase [Clostridia bacterium]|nr:M20/M25/M40 family metallo-hydrolase [Clostridia bacterium]